jgi:hypothetical protein
MRHQTPLALLPPAGTAHWGEEVLFSQKVMSELGGLNARFISLLVELHGSRPGMPALGLPSHSLPPLLRATGVEERLVLPFALFDLRFRDERFWTYESRAASAVQDGQPTPAADTRLLRFAHAVLTLAWHLVQVDPRVARLALGMAPGTQQVLEATPIGLLDALARRTCPAVSARFCTRERFWGHLGSALRLPPDSGQLERLRLLGLQLQGADAARAQQLHRRLRRSTQP